MCHGMGLTASRLTCSRSATAAAAAVALSWLPSLDLQSLRNRGSRRSGNGAGCCPRPTCSDRQSLRNRGSRRSGNGAGCCTRSTYSDRQSLRNRGSRRSSGNGACGCTALVLRVSSLPRTRQPLTRRRCSCEGAQCSCKCKWADARDSRPTQRRAAMGAAGGTAPVHGITNASATAPAARLWRLHGRPRRARQQPGSREAIARPI